MAHRLQDNLNITVISSLHGKKSSSLWAKTKSKKRPWKKQQHQRCWS